MKKLIAIATIAIVAASINIAAAKDVMMRDQLVKAVTVAYTKDAGNEYVRIIISEPRSLNGVKYTVGVAMMVFEADLLDVAKSLKPGAKFSCVADKGSYKGRTSYTLRAIIE